MIEICYGRVDLVGQLWVQLLLYVVGHIRIQRMSFSPYYSSQP